MSVDCDMYVGYTVTIRENLTHKDFDELEKFEDLKYNRCDSKIRLVVDGMNGEYARLIYVDKHNRDVWGNEDEPYQVIEKELPEDIYNILNEAYMEIQGIPLDRSLVEYAIWWNWY